MVAHRNYKLAEKSLRTAWKKAAKLVCENGLHTLTRKGSKAFGIYAVYSG